MTPVDDDSESGSQRINGHFRTHSSEEDLTDNMGGLEGEESIVEELMAEKAKAIEAEGVSAMVTARSKPLGVIGRELSSLEIPKRSALVESNISIENEKEVGSQRYEGYEETKGDEDMEKNEVESIPEESILKRISSLKETKSYQLGKQLSCKWTTGAGPRIGCVRDYPCELQFRALEQVNLSPRSGGCIKSSFISFPRSLYALDKTSSMFQRDDHHSRSESLPLIRGTSVIPLYSYD